MVSLPVLLLIATGAAHVLATDGNIIAAISADVVEAGSFGLAFFGGISTYRHKAFLIETLNQTPQLSLPIDTVSVVDNIQHANGNSMFLMNFPDFGSMILEDLRSKILEFHQQNPQFSQNIPIARIYFVTGSHWAHSEKTVRGGLQFLRDLYGMDIADQIQFLVTTTSAETVPANQIQSLFSEVFPAGEMHSAVVVITNSDVSHLVQDIHNIANETPSFYFEPQHSQSYLNEYPRPVRISDETDDTSTRRTQPNQCFPSEISRPVSDETEDTSTNIEDVDDLVEMPIDHVRAVQHLCHYARLCLRNLDESMEGAVIRVSRNLQLLYDLCDSDEYGLRLSDQALEMFNEADMETRFCVLQALAFLVVEAPVIDRLVAGCVEILAHDLLENARVSVHAIHQYMQSAFPNQDRVHTELLRCALTHENFRQRYCQLQMENMFLACPESSFMDLMASNNTLIPFASMQHIIMRRFSSHRPVNAPAEFVDLLVDIEVSVLWHYEKGFDATQLSALSLPSPDHVRNTLELIVQFSCAMPEYLNDRSDRPLIWKNRSLWHRLARIINRCALMTDVLTPEFLASLSPQLIEIAQQTLNVNDRFDDWADYLFQCGRDSGIIWLLHDFIHDPALPSVVTAELQRLLQAIVDNALPHVDDRRELFERSRYCSRNEFAAEVLFIGLESRFVFELFTLCCRMITDNHSPNSMPKYGPQIEECLHYIHGSYAEHIARPCLAYVTNQAGMPGVSGTHLALINIRFLLRRASNNCTGESLVALRSFIVDRPDAVRDHGPQLLEIMGALTPETMPLVYPYLILAGDDGMALYRQLEERISEETGIAIRRSARTILEPELWVMTYQTNILLDVSSLGLGQYLDELTSDLEDDRHEKFRRFVLLMLVRSNVQDIPQLFLESLLDQTPDQLLNSHEMDYMRLYWRLLDLDTDVDCFDRPLTNYILQHCRPEFFALLCTSIIANDASQVQQHRRQNFCTQMLLRLIERNPIQAANIFALSTSDPNLMAPVLRDLLLSMSNLVTPGPDFVEALGDQIHFVYQSLTNVSELHSAWYQWLTYMLPVSTRFPMEHFTASDLAFDAIHGLHPEVVLDHRSWLLDVICRVPDEDFNRVRNSKSILGELLLTVNQWPDALGSGLRSSVLHRVVARTSNWSVVVSDHYLDRIRSELAHDLKASLEEAIITAHIDARADWPLRDRQALSSVLFIAVSRRTSPDIPTLCSLLQICTFLNLQYPSGSYDLSWQGWLFPLPVFEILLQLFAQAHTLRLSYEDLCAAMSEYVNQIPPDQMYSLYSPSFAYSLLQSGTDFSWVRIRDLIESVIKRSSPKLICRFDQEDCILGLIREQADNIQDPLTRQWLDHIYSLCSQKIAAAGRNHICSEIYRRRRRASNIREEIAGGRADNFVENPNVPVVAEAPNADAPNANAPTAEVNAPTAEVNAPTAEVPNPDAPTAAANHSSFESVRHRQTSSRSDTTAFTICCIVVGVCIVAGAIYRWRTRRSHVIVTEDV